MRRAMVIPTTMTVSILTKPVVAADVPVAPAPAPAPAPRRFQPRRFAPRQRRPVAPRPPPPETLTIYDTKVWGPLLWRAIHTAAEASVGRHDLDTLWSDFAFELQMSLPCPDCMQHYRAWYATHSGATSAYATHSGATPAVVDATVARQWWADLHNAVNERKGLATWSVEDVAAANTDIQAGRDAVAGLATMLGPRAYRVLVALYAQLG
jgi:hypothetical protein